MWLSNGSLTRDREEIHLWTIRENWGMINASVVTKIPIIWYVYISWARVLMCKGALVLGEYKYEGVSPILNELGSGGSRMYPT